MCCEQTCIFSGGVREWSRSRVEVKGQRSAHQTAAVHCLTGCIHSQTQTKPKVSSELCFCTSALVTYTNPPYQVKQQKWKWTSIFDYWKLITSYVAVSVCISMLPFSTVQMPTVPSRSACSSAAVKVSSAPTLTHRTVSQGHQWIMLTHPCLWELCLK